MGVKHMHSLQIVHNDIRWENILLFDEMAVICDFGRSTEHPHYPKILDFIHHWI